MGLSAALVEGIYLARASSIVGMTCKTCKLFESSGPFISGTFSYRKDSLTTHEESETHKHNALKEKKRNNPRDSSAYKIRH